MKLSTQNLTALDHPEIFFEIQPEIEALAAWLPRYFEHAVRTGTRFGDGETVQVGWSLLKLRQVDDCNLEALEPDFLSMPIRWVQGANQSMRHLYLQRAVCELFQCEPDFPPLQLAGVVSPEFQHSVHYSMSREVSPGGRDSGWVFAEKDYLGPNGEFRSLYELSLAKSELVPFLALPPLSLVEIRNGWRKVVWSDLTKTSDDCDLLRELASGRR